ncbi:MAG: hypothetical protein GF349_02515 [Candidatus Magasanikbacteria bacterium]|nr:hypothetical protein [Candidatus Magasanikbacteria bacterium]
MKKFTNKFLLTSVILVVLGVFSNIADAEAYAAPPSIDPGYAARYVSQTIPDPIVVEAGRTKTVVISFKNVGKYTWDETSTRYISAYTREPKFRHSEFMGANWLEPRQTAKIKGIVKPGEIGELEIQVKAPLETGRYVEFFHLVADGYTWVEGGGFYLVFNVIEATAATETEQIKTENLIAEKDKINNKAKLALLSTKEVSAAGGQQVKVVAAFKNDGEKIWDGYSFTTGNNSALAAVTEKLTFADSSWRDGQSVLAGNKQVAPGEYLREVFYFRTPVKKGNYTASFKLRVAGEFVDGGEIEIPVTVTSDAPDHYQVPEFSNTTEVAKAKEPRLSKEPRIRVGLWKPEDPVLMRSIEDDYYVYAGSELKGVLKSPNLGTLSYENGKYKFVSKDVSFSSDQYIRLSPVHDEHAVFVLINLTRKIAWKGAINFNKYRGAMEYRYTQDGSTLYVINDLLFEDYVAGIAETSNYAHIEYIKALLTAARTYAYYVKEYSGKHDARNFDVVGHTGDQLYLGVISEEDLPNVKRAAEATAGYMVTYDTDNNPDTESDVVITPYYGNSDGRTRSWTEVWGGTPKPWLVSVKAEYDYGRAMFGHGVGISQRDAAYRAEEEELDWQGLLKYYYTGVEVERVY